MKKIKSWLTLIIFFSLSLIFTETITKGEIFTEKYGVNPGIIGTVLLVGEIGFIAGVILMLKASGIFKIKIKDIVKFDFSEIHFHSREFIAGFVINRLAAFLPWAYVLGVGWKKFPASLTGMIVLELLVVILLTLGVMEVTSKHAAKKS